MVPKVHISQTKDTKDDGRRVSRVGQCFADTGYLDVCTAVWAEHSYNAVSELIRVRVLQFTYCIHRCKCCTRQSGLQQWDQGQS